MRKTAVSGAMSGSRAESLLLFQLLLLLQLAVEVQKTIETSAAEPRYMTFEAQNSLLNKDTWLCTLTFGRCGDGAPSGLAPQMLDTKLYFEAKRPYSLNYSTDDTRTCGILFSAQVRGAPLIVPFGMGHEGDSSRFMHFRHEGFAIVLAALLSRLSPLRKASDLLSVPYREPENCLYSSSRCSKYLY